MDKFSLEALIATALLEKWGLVAAWPDGYDEAGRQKMRLMTPEETVERACEIATLAARKFVILQWHKQ